MRASLGTSIKYQGQVVHGRVGSNVGHAHVAHKGAVAHRITPNKKRLLSFYWDKAPSSMVTKRGRHAGKVALRHVNHPGHTGRHYLTVPLRYWGHLRGFKVYILTE